MKDKLYEKFHNKFCIFEGGDECGKTSIAKILTDYLNKIGIETIFTFQPGDNMYSPVAPFVRSLCKDSRWNLHPLSNFFMFNFDRCENIHKIVLPSLKEGKTVISDRSHFSTIAYQLYGKNLIKTMSIEVANWLMKEAVANLEPDIVFYFPDKLDVNRPEDKNDQFETESEAFQRRVHTAYEEMADKYNWIRVYPENTAEETFKKMLNDFILGGK